MTVCHDCCPVWICLQSSVVEDAMKPGFIVLWYSILLVLGVGGNSQVAPSIVMPNSVDMINLVQRPLSSDYVPDDAVR